MKEYDDPLFMQEGTITNDEYFILADTFTFWPDGQGSISKEIIQSAKNNGAKIIYINDLQTGIVYHTTIDDALSGGNSDVAVFLKHSMKKLTEDDLDKQKRSTNF